MANWKKALQTGLDTTGNLLIDKYTKDEAAGREQKKQAQKNQFSASQQNQRLAANKSLQDERISANKGLQTERLQAQKDLEQSKNDMALKNRDEKRAYEQKIKNQESTKKTNKERGKVLGKAYANELRNFWSSKGDPKQVADQAVSSGVSGLLADATMDDKLYNAVDKFFDPKKPTTTKEIQYIATSLSKNLADQGYPPEVANAYISAFFDAHNEGDKWEKEYRAKEAIAEIKARGKKPKDPLKGDVNNYLKQRLRTNPEEFPIKDGVPTVPPDVATRAYEAAKAGDFNLMNTTTSTSVPPQNNPQVLADQLRQIQAQGGDTKGFLQELSKNPQLYNQVKAAYGK